MCRWLVLDRQLCDGHAWTGASRQCSWERHWKIKGFNPCLTLFWITSPTHPKCKTSVWITVKGRCWKRSLQCCSCWRCWFYSPGGCILEISIYKKFIWNHRSWGENIYLEEINVCNCFPVNIPELNPWGSSSVGWEGSVCSRFPTPVHTGHEKPVLVSLCERLTQALDRVFIICFCSHASGVWIVLVLFSESPITLKQALGYL